MPTQRILIKARTGLPSATLALGAAQVNFPLVPLFKSIGRTSGLGAAAGSTWYVLEAPFGFDAANPWDVCHSLMHAGLGVAGAPVPEFAEPDLEQRWLTGDDAELGLALAAGCQAEGPDTDLPGDPNPFWYRDQSHTQLDAALAQIGGPDVAAQVRIAHCDTGYDPQHATLPKRLRRDLQRNFVDKDRPNDASDVSDGLGNNLGHGTGTLSILAGSGAHGSASLGCAPFAEVVPIRVANRVVLFHNSAIAQAFDYVHGLHDDRTTRIDIVTMSMGGLPAGAWLEAINALYEQGVFVVTAAGNNFGNLPTRNIVYPARFGRVVAACGVMADHKPYTDLDRKKMAGNYGPDSKMKTAVCGATPNVPWAKFGCGDVFRLNGAGTSAATPQVAATAAIWIQRNRAALDAYPQGWMKVEAVRKALFDSARADAAQKSRLGRGELRGRDALDQQPAAPNTLAKTAPDSASFAFLRTLTGLGLAAAPDAHQRMIELEALQLSQRAAIEAILPDPDVPPESVPPAERRRIAEALAAQPGASQALRDALGATARAQVRVAAPLPVTSDAVVRLHLEKATNPPVPEPPRRPLRVYAYDPSLGARLETLGINEATLDVRWEKDLKPGPVGEYLEIVDVDPASRCCYAPVDLNHPYLLTRSGLPPSEANPQFHQQMVYAVAMRTIEHFENALGRRALWAPRLVENAQGKREERYVQRLRIYPHALRARNAYYSPDRKALLLGYFSASATNPGDALPGGVVFTAVSHDIVAHETTHALLDGLHRRFSEPTNQDMLAFHEAFADIVALFQHFTLPEALRQQIAATRGDLGEQNLLAKLAVQFGNATGRYGALRDAIGKMVEEKTGETAEETWVRKPARRDDYEKATEAHDRGAVLVAAVFDAFLQLYRARTEDLVRLATQGSGVLPPGRIPVDLVNRLAYEASKVAGQVLNMCIRALDYCPPVDLTFGEYLRALITADSDLVPDDPRGYRTAFISAFSARGIYPFDVKHLSPGSLVWEPPPLPLVNIKNILKEMSLSWDLSTDRETAYSMSRVNAQKMHDWLIKTNPSEVSDDEIEALGLFRTERNMTIGGISGTLGGIEVHSVRPARRIGPDGQSRSHLVVEITQTFRAPPPSTLHFRGGCTLLIDLEEGKVRYLVRKRVDSEARLEGQQSFALESTDQLRATYFAAERARAEPFALLHHVHG